MRLTTALPLITLVLLPAGLLAQNNRKEAHPKVSERGARPVRSAPQPRVEAPRPEAPRPAPVHRDAHVRPPRGVDTHARLREEGPRRGLGVDVKRELGPDDRALRRRVVDALEHDRLAEVVNLLADGQGIGGSGAAVREADSEDGPSPGAGVPAIHEPFEPHPGQPAPRVHSRPGGSAPRSAPVVRAPSSWMWWGVSPSFGYCSIGGPMRYSATWGLGLALAYEDYGMPASTVGLYRWIQAAAFFGVPLDWFLGAPDAFYGYMPLAWGGWGPCGSGYTYHLYPSEVQNALWMAGATCARVDVKSVSGYDYLVDLDLPYHGASTLPGARRAIERELKTRSLVVLNGRNDVKLELVPVFVRSVDVRRCR